MSSDKRVFPSLFATLSGAQRDRIDEVLDITGPKELAQRNAGALFNG